MVTRLDQRPPGGTARHGSPLDRALAYGRRPAVRARWAATLQRLVRIPTVSAAADGDRLDQAAAFLRRELARIGMDHCRVLRSGRGEPPSVWGEWRRAPGQPMILLYGHFDVQPPGATRWTRPPFDGALAGGRIHGRGASDDKGPLVTLLAGLECHLAATGRLPVNVRIWLDGEEELGSPHLGPLLDRYGHLLHADGLALSDSTRLTDAGRPTLVTGLRGLIDLRLEVAGPGRPLHSGTFGGEVTDPAVGLARMIASLWDTRGRIAVPGFYRRVIVPTPAERRQLSAGRRSPRSLAAAAMIPAAALRGECGWEPGERSALRPSLTITGLRAGGTGRGATSAVPAVATARLNIRLVPGQRPAEVAALVARYLRRTAPDVNGRLTMLASAYPVVLPEDHPLLRAADRALRGAWGAPPVYARSGGTVPVVAELYRRYAIPAAMWGLSRPADRIHSADESFALTDLVCGAEAVTRLLDEVAR